MFIKIFLPKFINTIVWIVQQTLHKNPSLQNLHRLYEIDFEYEFVLHHEESVLTDDFPLLEDFKCKLCSKVFSTKDSLLNHKESVHTENVPLLEDSKCKLCSKVFSTNDSLLYHEESVHTETDSKDQTKE